MPPPAPPSSPQEGYELIQAGLKCAQNNGDRIGGAITTAPGGFSIDQCYEECKSEVLCVAFSFTASLSGDEFTGNPWCMMCRSVEGEGDGRIAHYRMLGPDYESLDVTLGA